MSSLKQYIDRSVGILKRRAGSALRMDPSPEQAAIRLLNFAREPFTPLRDIATGCDADIGGVSTANLEMIAGGADAAKAPATEAELSSGDGAEAPLSPSTSAAPASNTSHLAFFGTLSTHVPPEYAGRIRTGYAAMRNKSRPSIFGEDSWNLELCTHLRVQVAYRGWEGWRGKWVCNIQTDGPVRSDLFQHRLDLPGTYATPSAAPLNPATAVGLQFATLHLPLANFVLTNSGKQAENQIEMLRAKVRTVGFALLGGGRESAAPNQEQVRAAQEGHRRAAGGFGAPGANEEPDYEMAQLLASDLGSAAAAAPAPSNAGRYHRVGAAAQADVDPAEALTGTQEGYYELCIRSVDAVRYDPEDE